MCVYTSRGRWLAGVALVTIVALVLAACAQRPAAEQPAAPQAPEKIKIGAVLPLTGKESKPGTWQKLAYELAVKEVNDQGGIYVKEFDKKLPVELTVLDDGTDQNKTVQLLERLITVDQVDALLGGYSTTLVEAQAVMPDRYGVPYVNGGGAATAIYSKGYKYIFGTLAPIKLLGTTTMDFLKTLADQGKLDKAETIAVAWENTSHGKDYLAGIKEWLEQNPGYFQLVFDEAFELHGTDFTGLLNKIKQSGATIFLADAHLEDYITMHRQYTELGLYHKMVSYGARGPDAAAKEALGSATDYVFAGVWWHQDLPYPQVQSYINAWKAYTASQGEEKKPEWYSAVAYEAARTLFKAIEEAGTLDKQKVRDALDALVFEGSILPGQVIDFPAETGGQAMLPFVIVQNKPGGATEIVYPVDAQTGEPVAPVPPK